MKTTISPSLLACDFLNIESELRHFETAKDIWFHLDVMDGHFVPNLTFGQPIIKKISTVAKHPLDAHFMVTNPEFYIDELQGMNIHNFTFHYEAVSNPMEVIKQAKGKFPSIGISIKPGTSTDVLTEEILDAVDLVLVMSVEPGFGGQSFIESTYEKLATLKPLKEKFGFIIQVDGGVGDQNAKKLIDHGCDNLVAGSYVFKGGPATYIEKIESLRG